MTKYYPSYEEMQEALEYARLKMWHEHGQQIKFGPEFVMVVMEGLAGGEVPQPVATIAPPVEDMDLPDDVKPFNVVTHGGTVRVEAEKEKDGSDSEGAEGDRGVETPDGEGGDEAVEEGGAVPHTFQVNRGGIDCITCGKPESEH